MKIVHLTDTHITGYTSETFDSVMHSLMSDLKPARDYLIVITGDIQDYYSDTNIFRVMMRIEYPLGCCSGSDACAGFACRCTGALLNSPSLRSLTI